MRPPIAPRLPVQIDRLLAVFEQGVLGRRTMNGAGAATEFAQQQVDFARHALVRKHLVDGSGAADLGSEIHAEAVDATHRAEEGVEEGAEVAVCEGGCSGCCGVDEDQAAAVR